MDLIHPVATEEIAPPEFSDLDKSKNMHDRLTVSVLTPGQHSNLFRMLPISHQLTTGARHQPS